jgi:hypothetical protein
VFPVDFPLPCTAIAPYVKRASDMFGAKVTLAHVFDLGSSGGLELYLRPLPEVLADHHIGARNQLSSFSWAGILPGRASPYGVVLQSSFAKSLGGILKHDFHTSSPVRQKISSYWKIPWNRSSFSESKHV